MLERTYLLFPNDNRSVNSLAGLPKSMLLLLPPPWRLSLLGLLLPHGLRLLLLLWLLHILRLRLLLASPLLLLVKLLLLLLLGRQLLLLVQTLSSQTFLPLPQDYHPLPPLLLQPSPEVVWRASIKTIVRHDRHTSNRGAVFPAACFPKCLYSAQHATEGCVLHCCWIIP